MELHQRFPHTGDFRPKALPQLNKEMLLLPDGRALFRRNSAKPVVTMHF
jgi:hypothetical protein